jgi:hypothetical protein
MMTDRPHENRYDELKALIDDETKKEHECRKYLQYIPHYLFRETVVSYEYRETEYRGHSGDSDYVISGKVKDESGFECVRAYIWELKAPQCYIFEKDTKNRLRPTKDLIQAENQLLHYYEEQKGSDQFRDEFKVTHPDNVCFGGIIIGCNRTLVKGDYNEKKKERLFQRTKTIRDKHFYRNSGIRLVTWDTILCQFRPPIRGETRSDIAEQEIPMPKIPPGADIDNH